MQRVKTATAVTSKPAYSETGTPGYFVNGDAVAGTPATVPGQDWFNMVQEELRNLVVAAGLTPSATDDTQLAQAVAELITAHQVTISNASETVAGIIKQSTTAQALAGTNDDTAMSPADSTSLVNAIVSAALANVARTNVAQGWTKQQYPVPTEATGVSGTVTLDCNAPEYWQALTGATTYANPSNMTKGKRVTLDLYAAAAQTVSWGSLWVDNTYMAKPTSLSAGQRLRMTFDCVWNYSLAALCMQLVGLVPGV
jgi:hypothetical protein